MPRHRAPVAVCILRVEGEPERLLITMTVKHDIATATDQLVRRFTDRESAVAAVAEFLESAARNKRPLHVSGVRHAPP
jgi:hypothetical protein